MIKQTYDGKFRQAFGRRAMFARVDKDEWDKFVAGGVCDEKNLMPMTITSRDNCDNEKEYDGKLLFQEDDIDMPPAKMSVSFIAPPFYTKYYVLPENVHYSFVDFEGEEGWFCIHKVLYEVAYSVARKQWGLE